MGLGDTALVKENHGEAAGGMEWSISAVRATHQNIDLEVECDTADQVHEAAEVKCSLLRLERKDIQFEWR